jgi:tRNA A37 N6-isopentenylltransferase MiaA
MPACFGRVAACFGLGPKGYEHNPQSLKTKTPNQERRLLRALDVFPQSADLNSIYGDVQFFLRHDKRTAYKHYCIALESDPEHVPAACGMATAMLDLGVEQAISGT